VLGLIQRGNGHAGQRQRGGARRRTALGARGEQRAAQVLGVAAAKARQDEARQGGDDQ